MSGEKQRLALFALACLVLVGCAVGFSRGDSDLAGAGGVVPEHLGPEARRSEDPSAAVRALKREVRSAAHGFLAAFLRYEVGDLEPAVRRALRASATPSFAALMLARPPTPPPPGIDPLARVGPIAVAFASLLPPRAVVSAMADRGANTERLSFVFERRGSLWLAAGPGE